MSFFSQLMETPAIRLLVRSFVPMLKAGVLYTIPLSIISFVIGIILAILTALCVINKIPVLHRIGKLYIWIFRCTPLLVQLFIVYWGICNPLHISKWTAAIAALSLNVGAYSAETIRAAILSIDRGQWEAGYSIGMTYRQTFVRIIIPQAAKVSIPPLFNSFISLVKDTSLVSNIMIAEMFRKAQEIASSSFQYLAIYTEVAIIYLIFCSILTVLQKKLEQRLRVGY